MDNVMIAIHNGEKMYLPAVEEGIVWETERQGVAGKLTFKVIKDNILDFAEGNPVRMSVDGKNVFWGYVFTKSRDKDGTISVTAYDQLRYLKNTDVRSYVNQRADEVIRKIAKDFKLTIGELENTQYVIPRRRDLNRSLFDIIVTALVLTRKATGEVYVLYDDFGKLMLKNAKNMAVKMLIDAETAENFSYESSIDKRTYNRVKFYRDNKEKGKREIFISPQDWNEFTASENIKKWGPLQHCEAVDNNIRNPQAQADAFLQQHNKETRSLSIKNALGNTEVRGGSSVGVQLNLGDIIVNRYMLVERVKHVFTNKQHVMDLQLRGGQFD